MCNSLFFKAELEKEEEYFDRLEKKEAIEVKKDSITELRVTVVQCKVVRGHHCFFMCVIISVCLCMYSATMLLNHQVNSVPRKGTIYLESKS